MNSVESVCSSVCVYCNLCISELDFYMSVRIMFIARRGLIIKVMGQGQCLGLVTALVRRVYIG